MIHDLMRERYCAPEWALFFEVANGTGYSQRRYTDAVACNLFPSRGLEIHGFEFKSGRGDWLRELKNPAKAEQSAWKYCHRWYVVATKDVVKLPELPKGWGLILAGDKGLRQIVAAEEKEAAQLRPEFFAALARRACESSVDDKQLKAEYQRGYNAGYEGGKRWVPVSDYKLSYDTLMKKVSDFQKQTGIHFDYFNWKREELALLQTILRGQNLDPVIQMLERQKSQIEAALSSAMKVSKLTVESDQLFTIESNQG